MKLNKLVLTLTAAALLPAFAHANTDNVAASFERDLQRAATVETAAIAQNVADPLTDAISVALYGTNDPILASFERDLQRAASVETAAIAQNVADPLTDAIRVALNGTNDPVLASFERDLNHEPVSPVVMIAGGADPLNIVNAILNKGPDELVASFERDLQRGATAETVVIAQNEADPLADAISVALYGTSDPILASFERDLYREPINVAVVIADRSDPLDVINIALWKEMGSKYVVQAASAGNNRLGS